MSILHRLFGFKSRKTECSEELQLTASKVHFLNWKQPDTKGSGTTTSSDSVLAPEHSQFFEPYINGVGGNGTDVTGKGGSGFASGERARLQVVCKNGRWYALNSAQLMLCRLLERNGRSSRVIYDRVDIKALPKNLVALMIQMMMKEDPDEVEGQDIEQKQSHICDKRCADCGRIETESACVVKHIQTVPSVSGDGLSVTNYDTCLSCDTDIYFSSGKNCNTKDACWRNTYDVDTQTIESQIVTRKSSVAGRSGGTMLNSETQLVESLGCQREYLSGNNRTPFMSRTATDSLRLDSEGAITRRNASKCGVCDGLVHADLANEKHTQEAEDDPHSSETVESFAYASGGRQKRGYTQLAMHSDNRSDEEADTECDSESDSDADACSSCDSERYSTEDAEWVDGEEGEGDCPSDSSVTYPGDEEEDCSDDTDESDAFESS